MAGVLKQNAAELILGGWDKGVLANIEKGEILSIK